ncbi:MAG: hypothetical protein QOI80_2764, partial [Solirubrobacteraceae bacterium]|nr:hypothetical protein [Solirubrobacteraceae bacterium]
MRDPAELPRQPPLELQTLRVALVAALVCLAAAASASAQTPGFTGDHPGAAGLEPVSPALPVPGRRLTPRQVLATARAVPKIARVLRRHPGVDEEPYVRGQDEWQVAFRDGKDEIAQVRIDDATGAVTEAWTGIQVEWPMARGYRGAFGRRAASLPVWLGCLLLFLAPFLRPPWRLLHLDLAVLAALSVSFALFSDGHVRWSVPLAYPPLLYLLARLLQLARDHRPPEPLRIWGAGLLGAAVVFLLGFRLGLQAISSNVIDVGYSGVIGADKLSHLRDLYGSFPADNPHGDTYGPLAYLAYVPFELISPWHGIWDDLPAAHAAASAFDIACAGGLYLVGRGRSHQHGLLLAFLWLACPFTLLAANSGANDALTGALVLGAVAWRSGALAVAAGTTKLAPLVLLPLLVRTRRGVLGAAAVLAAGLALVLVTDSGLGDLWRRAVVFQLHRDSPFSVWGLYGLGGLQVVAQLAVAGLAVGAARVKPADRFALAAAVLL